MKHPFKVYQSYSNILAFKHLKTLLELPGNILPKFGSPDPKSFPWNICAVPPSVTSILHVNTACCVSRSSSPPVPHCCNWKLPFHSITLHLKISCPTSPAMPMARGMPCPVPQVKIEMESDYEDTDINPRGRHRDHRDMSSETTL